MNFIERKIGDTSPISVWTMVDQGGSLIYVNSGRMSVNVSPDEARALAAALIEVADAREAA